MKKNLVVLAVFAIAAVACNKELSDSTPAIGDVVTYTASVENIGTKTVLDGKKSKWVSGDKITLHNGTTGFEFSTTDAGEKADFTYAGNDFSADNGVIAVYPSGTYTADLAAKTVTASIPTWQQRVDGSYNTAAAVAVAYSENSSLAFKNATALLKFTVKNENVTHFNFYGMNSEHLSGNVLITLNEDNSIQSVEPQLTEVDGVQQYMNNVEVYAWKGDDDLYFKTGTTYYAAIAPKTLNGFGVKIRINGIDHEVKTYADEFKFEANTIYDLGELEYVAPETIAKLYVEDHTGWDALALYMWGTPNDAMGTWPGSLPSATEVKGGITYKVYDIPATVLGTKQNLIFNNNDKGSQTPDYKGFTFTAEESEVYMYVNQYGAVAYKLGETPTPPAAPVVTNTKTIYLIPNIWVAPDNPTYYEAWCWGGGSTDAWADFKETAEVGVFSAEVDARVTGIKILRKSVADHASHAWASWNEYEEGSIPTGMNCIRIDSWEGAVTWSAR